MGIKKSIILLALLCLTLLCAAVNCNQQKDATAERKKSTFTDPRDGQIYRTVEIGMQTWMAENLNFEANNSYCYDDDGENCAKYGRLYAWVAVDDVCPDGWDLPTRSDWDILVLAAGGKAVAGRRLKSKTGWAGNGDRSGNGTDVFGFSALPGGGRRDYYRRPFHSAGWYAYYWSADGRDVYNAYYREIINVAYDDGVNEGVDDKMTALSVRCVLGKGGVSRPRPHKPQITVVQPGDVAFSSFTDHRDGYEYRAVTIGGQTWMAENLNYTSDSSYCYEHDEANCVTYGRLYTWKAAAAACPAGWHLPRSGEWKEFMAALGGVVSWSRQVYYESYNGIGEMLKSKVGWNDVVQYGTTGCGTDNFGFSALPGGRRHYYYRDDYLGVGSDGHWWSATSIVKSGLAYSWAMYSTNLNVAETESYKGFAYSVRCVKD